MTILHAGHERGMVRLTGGAFMSTDSRHFNASRSRSAVSTSQKNSQYAYVDVAANIGATGVWFHTYTYSGSRGVDTGTAVLRWVSSTGATMCEFVGNASQQLVLRLLGQTASDVLPTTDITVVDKAYTIDLHVCHVDGTWVATLYVNGEQRAQTSASGTSLSLASIRLGGGESFAGYSWRWSELIVADTDTRGLTVKSSWPNGAGQYTESTGGYANVDEVTADALVAEFTAIDQRLLMTHSGVGTPLGQIVAVALGGQANADATSAPAAMFRAGDGQEHVDAQPLTTNPVLYDFKRLYFVNPITGQPWTVADLNAMQVGVKAIAR